MSQIKFYFPHNCKTQITCLPGFELPEINISTAAYMDIAYITSQSPDNEISWLGSVDLVDGNYIINNVYLLEQTVSMASISVSEVAYAKLIGEIIRTKGIKEANKLKFWGHLHPGDSTSPSQEDNKQMKVFQRNCKDFFIRGIFSRSGKAEFSVFDYNKTLCFEDVSWFSSIDIDTKRKEEIKKLIKEKVKKEVILPFIGKDHAKNYPYGLDDEFFKYHNIDC